MINLRDNHKMRQHYENPEEVQPLPEHRQQIYVSPSEKINLWSFLLRVILVLILVFVVGIAFIWFSGWQDKKSEGFVVDGSRFQAVFLTNGQVYFGKVDNERDQYVSLNQVYYLVLKQPLQSQEQVEKQDQNKNTPEYSIQKLGQELHGPDSMSINRDQILFIENLRDDSKVVDAIKQSK